MSHIIHSVFDGEVLRPEESLRLKANTRYKVTVEEEDNGPDAQVDGDPYPSTALLALAEDLGVTDLAERHDFYAHHRK
ncbi:MAG: hypothetical protein ACLPY2_27885 [Bryobacteraceae bacterium]|jgi:hypothetical protein